MELKGIKRILNSKFLLNSTRNKHTPTWWYTCSNSNKCYARKRWIRFGFVRGLNQGIPGTRRPQIDHILLLLIAIAHRSCGTSASNDIMDHNLCILGNFGSLSTRRASRSLPTFSLSLPLLRTICELLSHLRKGCWSYSLPFKFSLRFWSCNANASAWCSFIGLRLNMVNYLKIFPSLFNGISHFTDERSRSPDKMPLWICLN